MRRAYRTQNIILLSGPNRELGDLETVAHASDPDSRSNLSADKLIPLHRPGVNCIARCRID